jgi:hypothetical protein
MAFSNGLARFKLSGKRGYIGLDGKCVWTPSN